MDKSVHEQWKAITSYYERSSYTQQCIFVDGLVSKISDFKDVEAYHNSFKKALEGLNGILRRTNRGAHVPPKDRGRVCLHCIRG